ncbi:hypothetical protein C0416_02315 [bacterium]|nr:hypothetical protein [bacterium]
MNKSEFESKIQAALEKHKELVVNYKGVPSEEKCEAMVNAFNVIIQTVMDEVGSREDWESKFKVIRDFEKTVQEFYGIAVNITVMTMKTLYERMLLGEWGVDNPHDPFHKHDGQK